MAKKLPKQSGAMEAPSTAVLAAISEMAFAVQANGEPAVASWSPPESRQQAFLDCIAAGDWANRELIRRGEE